MKKNILYALIFTCTFINAQNNLRVYSAKGSVFKLFINKNLANEHEQANVLVTEILLDTITVKIEFENNLTLTKTIYLLEKTKKTSNKEFVYKVENLQNKLVISFISVNEIQKLISPIVPLKPIMDTTLKYKNNVLGHFCELKNNNPTYFNNLPKKGDCTSPMPAEYINYTAILINKTQVSDEKFEVLENVFKNNCISVQQTNMLLKHIDYEIEKLKLIKIAFYNLTDKTNVKNLETSFKFESSKKELSNLLLEVKNNKQSAINKCVKAAEDIEIKSFTEKLNIFYNDAERYETFKKLYPNYCYSSVQVKLVLQTFLHDREKLDASKLLYYYCTDSQNYLSVSDVFSYKQTESELSDFVEKQR